MALWPRDGAGRSSRLHDRRLGGGGPGGEALTIGGEHARVAVETPVRREPPQTVKPVHLPMPGRRHAPPRRGGVGTCQLGQVQGALGRSGARKQSEVRRMGAGTRKGRAAWRAARTQPYHRTAEPPRAWSASRPQVYCWGFGHFKQTDRLVGMCEAELPT
jgi:hypothetical protein